VKITYDPAKNERNIRERGLSFERAQEFDFETAYLGTEVRSREIRKLAVGYLERRLHVLCYLVIPGSIRVISFRRANERGEKVWQTENPGQMTRARFAS
jgi:uncharacterized DUF497 family protein